MNPKYIEAIETRLRWLRLLGEPDKIMTMCDGDPRSVKAFMESGESGSFTPLATGETYFMDKHFCSLVEHASPTLPEPIKFELEWMLSSHGWLCLETPVDIPAVILNDGFKFDPKIGAIGWLPTTDKSAIAVWVYGVYPYAHRYFAPFLKVPLYDGKSLAWNIEDWKAGKPSTAESVSQACYTTRWVYAALYFMAQQLTSRVRYQTDRATRRRAEKIKQNVPPFIEVITLRRKQQDREAAKAHQDIDWQWQWAVRGHWRDQWYPAEGIHKPVFIESYIKGPEDKPVKPPTTKLFAAIR